MPVFLSRNARHSRKHTVGKISVNIEGNPATLKELQAGDAGEENSPNSSKNAKASDANSSSSSFSSSSTSNGSKQQLSHSNVGGAEGEKQRALNESTSEATGATGGKVKSSQQEESGATTGKGETNPSSSPAAAAAVSATRDSCGNGGKAASSGNNNNLNNINNNNSICSSTNKQLDNPLWFGGSGVKKAPPPERLPCMNGADRNLLYIDDSEQMKVNRTFKTNQVQKKNFTMYRPGALTRARKSHCRVTTRMNQRFKKVVDTWLDQHVTASQRAMCVDWLLGKRQDLMKNTTSVIVQDNGLSRTPYAPYNRYKVDQIETMME